MSIATGTQRRPENRDVPTCSSCGGYRNPNNSYHGSFCSERCWYAHKGSKAQNLLKHDHRICASCGALLKTIDPPSEDWQQKRQSLQQVLLENGGELVSGETGIEIDATEVSGHRPITEAIIGFQDKTPKATEVTREFGDSEFSVQNKVTTALGCECGNADTSCISDALQDADLVRVLTNYVLTFRLLYQEGQLDQKIDKDTFFSSFRDTRDIQYSLGVALYA